MARQFLEEGEASIGVEVVIAVEHLAGHGDPGGLAAAREQRLAELDQFGGIVLAVGRLASPQQRAAAFGNRREKVGEKGISHGNPTNPNRAEDLGGSGSESSLFRVRKYVMPREGINPTPSPRTRSASCQ